MYVRRFGHATNSFQRYVIIEFNRYCSSQSVLDIEKAAALKVALQDHGDLHQFRLLPVNEKLLCVATFVQEGARQAEAAGNLAAEPRPDPGRGAGPNRETSTVRRAGENNEAIAGRQGSAARRADPRTESTAPVAPRAAGAGPAQARTTSGTPPEELHCISKEKLPRSRAEEEGLAAVTHATAPPQPSHSATEQYHGELAQKLRSAGLDTSGLSAASAGRHDQVSSQFRNSLKGKCRVDTVNRTVA